MRSFALVVLCAVLAACVVASGAVAQESREDGLIVPGLLSPDTTTEAVEQMLVEQMEHDDAAFLDQAQAPEVAAVTPAPAAVAVPIEGHRTLTAPPRFSAKPKAAGGKKADKNKSPEKAGKKAKKGSKKKKAGKRKSGKKPCKKALHVPTEHLPSFPQSPYKPPCPDCPKPLPHNTGHTEATGPLAEYPHLPAATSVMTPGCLKGSDLGDQVSSGGGTDGPWIPSDSGLLMPGDHEDAFRPTPARSRPEDVEDCVACRYIWLQVEGEVGNAQVEDDIYKSFSAACKDASEAQLFFPACQDMYNQADDMIGDYMDGYTVNQVCENARLCR